MALYLSKHATGKKPVPTPVSGLIAEMLLEYTTEANLAAGDIIDMGPLPPGMNTVDVALASDDLDSNGTPTITLSVGILNAGKTDLNGGTFDTFIAASTVAQNGGVARATTPNCYLCPVSNAERRLGIKVVAGAATGVGAGKKLALKLAVTA